MLTFVPTPIGNLGDITPRAMEILREAELFICEDTRVAKALLSKLSKTYGVEFGAKDFCCLNSHNAAKVLANLDASRLQKAVYLSDAGMPCISDPGSELVKFAQSNDIAYSVLPGASAAICALAASGFSDKEFLFYGFLNIKKSREAQLQDLLAKPYAVVLYEAPTRILELFGQIAAIAPSRQIFAAKEISKLHEKFFCDSAENLHKSALNIDTRGEWVVVISPNLSAPARAQICESDILAIAAPPREKAKLLSKLNGRSVKQNYEEITKC